MKFFILVIFLLLPLVTSAKKSVEVFDSNGASQGESVFPDLDTANDWISKRKLPPSFTFDIKDVPQSRIDKETERRDASLRIRSMDCNTLSGVLKDFCIVIKE